jgi:RNA polymerase sigma-70 factor (ECF subfamily)
MGANRIAIMCDRAQTRISPSAVVDTSKLSGQQAEGADDGALVRDAQRGDTTAFEELVRRYDRPVLRLALHLTGSEQDAQDIYQEAFLRAYRNMPRFRFECSFYTWIYRIVTDLCLDHLRMQIRVQNVTTTVSRDGKEYVLINRTSEPSTGSSPEPSRSGGELGPCILGALRKLSPRERMVFELRHYQGLKLRTVASFLNMSESTIRNTLFRATRKLRTQLAEGR